MSSVPQPRFVTEAQYLATERKAPTKSRYYRGEMFAMAGATREHSLIAANLLRHLGNHLADQPCEVHTNDLRIRISASGLYTYHDVTVVCDVPQFLDDEFDTLLNPTLLAEVLSVSNQDYDRGFKAKHYRMLDSLRELLLIDQTRAAIERYLRSPDGSWQISDFVGLDATLRLESIKYELPLAEIYAKVKFPPELARDTLQ